jgi:copper chaperone CopZ
MRILSVLAIAFVMLTLALTRATDDHKTENPATQTCSLKVSGMTCAGCEAAVRMAARSIDGVKEAKVSYATGSAEVTYDPGKTTPDAISKIITEKSGFKAELVRAAAKK